MSTPEQRKELQQAALDMRVYLKDQSPHQLVTVLHGVPALLDELEAGEEVIAHADRIQAKAALADELAAFVAKTRGHLPHDAWRKEGDALLARYEGEK